MSVLKANFKTACRICRERKVKCDRGLPCHNCSAASVDCTYPPQVRTVRRPKKAAAAKQFKAHGDASLVNRLNRLESFLRRQAPNFELVDDDDDEDLPPSDLQTWAPRSNTGDGKVSPQSLHHPCNPPRQRTNSIISQSPSSTTEDQGRSAAGNTSDSPGANDPGDALPTATASPRHGTSAADQLFPGFKARTGGFPFPQGQNTGPPLLLSTHHRAFCWARYTENVDPLIKIIHKPSMKELMSVEVRDGQKLHPASLALVQAICLISITSTTDDDVLANLKRDRQTLLHIISSLVEQALMAADFLATSDMRTLQALLLFLYYLKYKGDPRLFALCGVAVNISLSMGLNNDPHSSSLPRLDIELRRRLWWQLVTFVGHPDDSDLHSFHLLNVAADTKIPLNLDDEELENGTTYTIKDRHGFTDASFSLIQYEIIQSYNQTQMERGSSTTTLTTTVSRTEERLRYSEESYKAKYFRTPLPLQGFQDFAAKTSALILAKRCFLSHLSRGKTAYGTVFGNPEAENRLFRLGVEVLELSQSIQRAREYGRWRWLHGIFFQWTVASFVIKELPFRSEDAVTAKACTLVDGIFDNWPDSVRESKRAALLRASISEAFRRRKAIAMCDSMAACGGQAESEFPGADSVSDAHSGPRPRDSLDFSSIFSGDLEPPVFPPFPLNTVFSDCHFGNASFDQDLFNWGFPS